MSRVCSICGKGIQFGNKVSHANNKTKKVSYPNLHVVKAIVNGSPKKIKVCSKCLKAGKVEKAVSLGLHPVQAPAQAQASQVPQL